MTTKTLTDQEIDALFKALEAAPRNALYLRNYCIISLLYDCGLRVGELVQLRFSDFVCGHQMAQSLRIRGEIAKCGIERVIPLNIRAKGAILAYHIDELKRLQPHLNADPQGPSFFDRFAFRSGLTSLEHLSTRQVERMVQQTGLIAIGREITPHSLRHSFGTRLAAVAQINVVRTLLGHKNLSSTQVYTHATTADLQAAIAAAQKR
jgi:integrase/recombinase XerC